MRRSISLPASLLSAVLLAVYLWGFEYSMPPMEPALSHPFARSIATTVTQRTQFIAYQLALSVLRRLLEVVQGSGRPRKVCAFKPGEP